uniref:F-box/LRR-repeat protein 8 n=1 Tax=Phallusia mammillata TaxID=59560 RepID=A0A6F9DCU1_9ASCI|nr:F-box/LRR-repeat protein 8-like [Phallusia mammillata]
MEYLNWSTVPDHILVDIFSYLPVNDRLQSSLVCKSWSECFHHPKLWSKFMFKFDTDIDNEGKAITCIEKYCKELKDVEIYVNQAQKISRERALQVMDELTSTQKKKLQKFAFHFTGANPLCFKGQEILDSLKKLFSRKPDEEIVFQLSYVDLNHCNIALDNDLILTLANQHQALRVVHLQNSCLVDNVKPSCIKELIQKCPFLEELDIFYHCLNDSVMEAMCEKRKVPFKILSLLGNRSDKYKAMIETEMWKKFKEANSEAQVTLQFHMIMPHHLIIPMLCPGIPLTRLHLKVYGWLTDELNHIGRTYWDTLKFLSFHTSLDHSTKAPPGLEPALLDLVSRCDKLEELHCYCTLQSETITRIKTMKSLTNSTLYCETTNP